MGQSGFASGINKMASCPVCGEAANEATINVHLDKGCPKPKAQQQQQWSFLGGKKSSPSRNVKASHEDATSPSGASQGASQSQPESYKREAETPETDSEPPAKRKAPQRNSQAPLAEQMRPSSLDEYIGQAHLMGPDGLLRQLLTATKLPSMVLWGPSGVGKTSLARVLALQLNARFIELSAPSAGSSDVKRIVTEARHEWQLMQRRTLLFLDEIHRFSRLQQDSLLQAVERGDVTLIGATTENPSFKLSGALLSRLRVFVLQPLSTEELQEVVRRADPDLPEETKELIVSAASATGDARQALNMLETVRSLPPGADPRLVLKHSLVYDQRGDFHYDAISAFHKSIRGGDADAALYYLGRMLAGGEDPLYISRRLMRMASEDIGLADDSCLPFAVAVHTSVQQIGMPEADVMLAHAAVKFARARKSVEVYKAYKAVASDISQSPTVSGAKIPVHLRNAPTKLMEDLGHGAEYKYNPDYMGPVHQEYLPEEIANARWLGRFQPTLRDTVDNGIKPSNAENSR